MNDEAIVLSSWERQRQTLTWLLLLLVPLPPASYHARAPRIGHGLLVAFVAATVGAVTLARGDLLYAACAIKGLDAWLGPQLLAQHQRRLRV